MGQAIETVNADVAVHNDLLAYMADLLSELQSLAEKEACLRLASLLAQSHEEALRQSRRTAG